LNLRQFTTRENCCNHINQGVWRESLFRQIAVF
jgi:hypothetical protein